MDQQRPTKRFIVRRHTHMPPDEIVDDHPHFAMHTDHVHHVWCPRHNHYYDDRTKKAVEAPGDLSGIRDFIAGSFAGVSSTVVGHPFDTVKVRLQMHCPLSSSFKGPLDCVMQTINKEGFLGLYRGMVSPMTTVPLVNAVVFSTYESAKSFLLNRRDNHNGILTNNEAMLAGAWAGLMNSVVVTPVELVKCHLQAQGEAIATHANEIKFTGTLDCVKKIIEIDGIRGLWRGQVATMYREVPSYIGQKLTDFGLDELLQQVFTSQMDGTDGKPSATTTLLAGGFAGCVCWTVSYPQDVVKSRLQLQPLGQPPLYAASRLIPDGGWWNCFRAIVKEEGPRALWKGYSPCLVRAFPANAAGFFTYEMVRSVLFDEQPELIPLH
ncbi:carrier superfamily protein [Achlya hypogyna]|uniref:Carrier superfamily protein n=1 Tax=Achlya hypogyna TaxID=1202772 RepID=A0A1V9ZKI0_ACHHY|nr:carrier superfamily protein [Achlya hypogyna]